MCSFLYFKMYFPVSLIRLLILSRYFLVFRIRSHQTFLSIRKDSCFVCNRFSETLQIPLLDRIVFGHMQNVFLAQGRDFTAHPWSFSNNFENSRFHFGYIISMIFQIGCDSFCVLCAVLSVSLLLFIYPRRFRCICNLAALGDCPRPR